jgi:hypothetical protein
MPEPNYADNPPGCFFVLLGLIVLSMVALILKSCL